MAVLSLRFSTPEDDVAVGELLVASFETQNQAKLGVRSTLHRLADLRDQATKRKNATVIVGELDGRIVSTVTVYRAGANGSEAWAPGAVGLRYLAVDPALAGQGLSTQLLDEAVEVAWSWGSTGMCLRIRREADGLARLYARHGFVRDGRGDVDLLPEIFLLGFYRDLQ